MSGSLCRFWWDPFCEILEFRLRKRDILALSYRHAQAIFGARGLRYLTLSKFSSSQTVLSLNRIRFDSIGLKCCIIVFLCLTQPRGRVCSPSGMGISRHSISTAETPLAPRLIHQTGPSSKVQEKPLRLLDPTHPPKREAKKAKT